MTRAELAALWDRLNAELARAEREHRRIQEEVNRILLQGPVGMALSDGQYRRIKAAAEARATFENYQKAVERFRSFVDKGTVPEDLPG